MSGMTGIQWEGPGEFKTPATARDFSQYPDVQVQVVGVPGTPYVPQRSFDGVTFVDANAYDKDGVTVTSISAAGVYYTEGGCWLRFNVGAGSTLFVRAGV